MRKLPIGIQSFEKLREENFVYVDKTAYIAELVNSGSVFFLSRPRRFGKSLFISTLEAYFLGRKELFGGLEIEKYEMLKPKEEQWTVYPIFLFSLSGGAFQTEQGLAIRLAYELDRFEKRYGIAHQEKLDLPTQFQYCIEESFRLTGKRVVVLVDEYDKPLLETMDVNTRQEQANHDLLKSFFSILKDEDRYLRFVLISGVTKFNKVSIFSDLNQLKDISLLPAYSAICGITEKELMQNFAQEVCRLAQAQELTLEMTLEKLARVYDGYHFSEKMEGVYNPFSILNAFSDCRFGRYWFESGTPTFLIRRLMESGLPVQDFSEGVRATEESISNYRADYHDLVPIYYQTCYLTISAYDREFQEYTLSYPNEEVKYGYLNSLIPAVNPEYASKAGVFSVYRMIGFLRDNDMEPFMIMLQALLAGIPYHEGKVPSQEQQWRNIVYAIFTVLGQYVRAEVHSANGRSDCVVENERYFYIFEFKQDKTAEEALKQIDDRGYALPYAASQKKVIKVGADFSTEKRTLDAWKIVG